MYKRIYVKHEGQRQFKPLDYSAGQQVTNLIYATIWGPEVSTEYVQGLCDYMEANNEGLKAEVRTIKQ